MCLTQGKDKATSVKKKRQNNNKKQHKGQLKMMEVEQNLRKILAKVHWQKCPKRYIYKKEMTYQYIVKATQMSNSNIN